MPYRHMVQIGRTSTERSSRRAIFFAHSIASFIVPHSIR
jgi:hypothetical protein